MGDDEDFWHDVAGLTFGNEADVETRLVLPLLAALGYARDEIVAKPGIIFQEGRRGRKPEADYIVYAGSDLDTRQALIVVEAKRPSEDTEAAKRQAESYAFAVRAPFVLVTDGISLELWQWQPSRMSENIFREAVADLAMHRGWIERLLSREAAINHARNLDLLSVAALAQDLSPYRTAMLAEPFPGVIERRLIETGNSKSVKASEARTAFGFEAFVSAPSGFGKTMLARHLFREAIANAAQGTPVPFLVPLADVAEIGTSLIGYCRERLAAHCPQYGSVAAFATLLRERGAWLLLDGFDRVEGSVQMRLLAELRALRQDFPSLSYLLLGRTPPIGTFAAQRFTLAGLDQGERQNLIVQRSRRPMYVAHEQPPGLLEPLSESPLLLSLILDSRDKHGVWPRDLKTLFETWIEQLIAGHGASAGLYARLRTVLRRIAVILVEQGRSTEAVMRTLASEGFQDSLVDRLAELGAIQLYPHVEIAHDALAEYLRVEALLLRPLDTVLDHIATAPFAPGSFEPVLVVTLARDEPIARAMWARAARDSIALYCNILRYYFLPALPVENMAASCAHAAAILQGINEPLEGLFEELANPLRRQLCLDEAPALGIEGHFDNERKWFSYSLFALAPGEQAVRVGLARRRIRAGHQIEDRWGTNDPRLVGFGELKRALAKLIDRRELSGGSNWHNDLAAGRVRLAASQLHTRVEIDLSASLNTIERQLEPVASFMVGEGGNMARTVRVSSIIDDLRSLRARGATHFDRWWDIPGSDPCDPDGDPIALARLLDAYWRRSQLIYRELVEHSFPRIAKELNFYRAMPVRFEVEVEPVDEDDWHGRVYSSLWMPVSSWDEAGATVTVGTSGLPDFRATYDRVQARLAELGRQGVGHVDMHHSALPRFHGSPRGASTGSETPALRLAIRFLSKDLNLLFDKAPKSLSDKPFRLDGG